MASAAFPFEFPRFDLAYVISDLHLGGPKGRQMFAAGDSFTAFIAHLLKEHRARRKTSPQARTLLVINGDFVDFLAEENAAEFNPDTAPTMLAELLARKPFDKVRDGLRELVGEAGTHLVITLGNHDLELALPATRRVLLEELTKASKGPRNADLEGKIELCFDGWGYRFQVGERRALCLHGNETDEFNFTRYDELDRIIHDFYLFGKSEFGAKWRPSAGSWFVINAVNPIKAEFPWVDLLKPETSVMPTVLGVLDPSKLWYVKELSRMAGEAYVNDTVRPKAQRRMLSVDAPASSPTPGAPRAGKRTRHSPSVREIEERVEHAHKAKELDELIRRPVDAEMLGIMDWKWVDRLRREIEDVSAEVTEFAQSTTLRKLLQGLLTEGLPDARALDKSDDKINGTVRAEYDVVFAGHTHLRRFAPWPNARNPKRLYVNTGTWAGLITLTLDDLESTRYQEIFDAFASGERKKLEAARLVRHECTFARMASEGKKGAVHVSLGGVDSNRVTFLDGMTSALPVKE